MLGACFNQDWQEEASTLEGIIGIFMADELPEKVYDLRNEIKELLSTEQVLCEDFIYDNNGYYSPEADGLSVRQWL